MSASGTIILYGVDRPGDPRESLRRLIELTGAGSYLTAHRTAGEDRSWEEFQAELEESLEAEEEGEEDRGGAEETPGLEEPAEEVFRPVQSSLSDLHALFQDGGNLWVQLRESPVLERIRVAVERGIPREVRGDHSPAELYLRCGYHDIFECQEHQEGLYVARAFFSVQLLGSTLPWQRRKFEKLFDALPEVEELRRGLEALIGPVGTFFEWSP